MFRYSRHCTLWAVAGASWRHKVTSLSSQGFWLCTNAWWDCFAVQWNKLHFWCVTAKSFMSDFLRLGTLTHNRATWENAESKARELFIIIVCMKWKLYCLNACYWSLKSSIMHMFNFFNAEFFQRCWRQSEARWIRWLSGGLSEVHRGAPAVQVLRSWHHIICILAIVSVSEV